MYRNSLKDILYLLLEQEGQMRIRDIAKELHLSEKTVWNKLHDEKITALLGETVTLQMKTNHGIILQGSREALRELKIKLDLQMALEKENEDYISNKIILKLLMCEDYVTIQELTDEFLITKNKLSLFLDEIAIRLQRFALHMEKRQNAGIRIYGNEVDIRQLLENLILQQCGHIKVSHHQNPSFDEVITVILKELRLDACLENAVLCVKQIQQELLGAFTDEGKKEIIIQILITQCRCEREHRIRIMEQETFIGNMKFHLFLKIFEANRIFLEENDYLYLWKRCVTNRFSLSFCRPIDERFQALSEELLHSVLDLSEKEDEEVNYLIQNLAFHIAQAVNRSALGIRVHNPILQKVKQKYGRFYSLVLTNVSRFEKEYSISLNEDEIGFITIYICAIYEKSIHNHYYRVLLVSDEGVGQTQLLSLHIVNNFPNLLIHQTSSSLHLKEQQIKEADIVIATCPLLMKREDRHKYIRISNFIDQRDMHAISEHLLNMGKMRMEEQDTGACELAIDFKYFNSSMQNREELLQRYLQIAEQFGYCDEQYTETVMEREKRASTSIGRGVAIPHGDDSHILKPAVFFVRNQTPILWGEEYVDIIIFLILKFNSIAENKQFFMRLYSCVSKTELVRQVKDRKSLSALEDYIREGEQTI